jgi:hypothetical protein
VYVWMYVCVWGGGVAIDFDRFWYQLIVFLCKSIRSQNSAVTSDILTVLTHRSAFAQSYMSRRYVLNVVSIGALSRGFYCRRVDLPVCDREATVVRSQDQVIDRSISL